jgi:hypothetical protein
VSDLANKLNGEAKPVVAYLGIKWKIY